MRERCPKCRDFFPSADSSFVHLFGFCKVCEYLRKMNKNREDVQTYADIAKKRREAKKVISSYKR